MMSINPDAHTIGELDLIRWGLAMARKGGVPKEKTLNCLDLTAVGEYFERRKLRAVKQPLKQSARARLRSTAGPPVRAKLRRRA